MAEAVFRYYWRASPQLPELDISSAGIYAFEGDRATAEVQQLLAEEGIDVSGHRSRRLSPEMVGDTDLIIVMTRNHKDHLLQLTPEARPKVMLLKQFAGEEYSDPDIADPYGGDLKIYCSSLQEIKDCVLKLADSIEEYIF